MEKINVKLLLEDNAIEPKYMTEGSAGMDIYSKLGKDSIDIMPLERVAIPTGVRMEIPVGYEIQVRPRSGLALKEGLTLINPPGTIDSDYRGEIKILMINLSKEIVKIKDKQRIAQLVLKKVYFADLKKVNQIENTERNSNGFGHTGRH